MRINHSVLRTVLLSASFLFLLSACGQKGPLFLPPDNETVTETQANIESATTSNDDSTPESDTPAN